MPGRAWVGEQGVEGLSEVSALMHHKRRRVDAPETEGIIECAIIRASTFPGRVREIGRDLDNILAVEKEKKKLSAAAQRSILDIRGRYEGLLDEA